MDQHSFHLTLQTDTQELVRPTCKPKYADIFLAIILWEKNLGEVKLLHTMDNFQLSSATGQLEGRVHNYHFQKWRKKNLISKKRKKRKVRKREKTLPKLTERSMRPFISRMPIRCPSVPSQLREHINVFGFLQTQVKFYFR